MAKNVKGTSGKQKLSFGFIAAVVYAILLAIGGMFLWVYLNPKVDSFVDKAVEYDTHVSEDLVRFGLTDLDIAVQSRLEKSDKRATWIEYYKEVLVPTAEVQRRLAQAINITAQKYGLSAAETKQEHKLLVVSSYNGRVLYRLLIAPKRFTIIPKKKVAIVIDDAGGKADISAFLGLRVPITFAIMPHERHSQSLAQRLSKHNIPFILHLPLQPEGYPTINPGKSALLLSMSEREAREKFISNLASVPGAAGVSNHMGSAYSADEAKMRQLLTLVKEHSLFYLDSYTTAKSKAGTAQKALGMKKMSSDFFLDDKDDPAAIRHQLQLLLAQVNRTGKGIAIGHMQRKNLVAALKEFIPQFKKANVEFVYITGMLE
jgi:polysaccharide deacetylase 2 family uncharacterized protein YibQ